MGRIFVYDFMQRKDRAMKERNKQKSSEILSRIVVLSADDILKECGQYGCLPIDITAVASHFNIDMRALPFKELEKRETFKDLVEKNGIILGALAIEEDSVTIYYDDELRGKEPNVAISSEEKSKKLKARQRFTIAHELAHCILGAKKLSDGGIHIEFRTDMDVSKPQTSEKQLEFEANVFAGELLIPLNVLNKVYEIYKRLFDALPPLDQLSDLFCVSKRVMSARLKYLKKPYIVSE